MSDGAELGVDVWYDGMYGYYKQEINTMQYAEAKEIRDTLTQAHKDTVQLMNDLSGASRGQFGLTPDHIKQSHKWKTIYAFERAVFQNVRMANEYMVKHFSAEMKAERDHKRLTQTQP